MKVLCSFACAVLNQGLCVIVCLDYKGDSVLLMESKSGMAQGG